MLTEDQLWSTVKGSAHASGGELFFRAKDALDVVVLCEQNQLAVVKIEGFELGRRDRLRPRMDLIADFASPLEGPWATIVRECADSARAFLQRPLMAPLDGSIVFSFLVLSERERDARR